MADRGPRVALVLGDPTGSIGPELVAKLLAQPDVHAVADVEVIGSREELLRAQRIAGVEPEGAPVIHEVTLAGALLPHGEVSAEAGRHCLESLALGPSWSGR